MIDEIYNQKILMLAGNIPRLGQLSEPDAEASAHSRLCGSEVHVYFMIGEGRVTDFAHEVKACALGQASSSYVAAHIIGETVAGLFRLRDQMYAMLKDKAAPPTGRWQGLEVLTPVRDFKARHASTLLTFDAVVKALASAGFSASSGMDIDEVDG